MKDISKYCKYIFKQADSNEAELRFHYGEFQKTTGRCDSFSSGMKHLNEHTILAKK